MNNPRPQNLLIQRMRRLLGRSATTRTRVEPNTGTFESSVRRAFQNIATASPTLPRTSLPKVYDNEDQEKQAQALHWLELLPTLTTAESIANGKPRFIAKSTQHQRQDFAQLTRALGPELTSLLTEQASAVKEEPTPDSVRRSTDAVVTATTYDPLIRYWEKSRQEAIDAYFNSAHDDELDLDAEAIEDEPEVDYDPGPNDTSRLRRTPASIDQVAALDEIIKHIASIAFAPIDTTPVPPDGEILEIHRHNKLERGTRPTRRPSGATNVGIEPEHWDRYSEDLQVFKAKRPGGTVLIDCSGSMSWDWDKLRRDLKPLPATTVATYSGSDSRGRLCIVAENGRWSDIDPDEMAGGNDVDIESLQWLAKQKGPRVWVSDGEVIGGLVSRLGRDEASTVIRDLCRSAHIVRTKSLKTAVEALSHPGQVNNKVLDSSDPAFIPSSSGSGWDF